MPAGPEGPECGQRNPGCLGQFRRERDDAPPNCDRNCFSLRPLAYSGEADRVFEEESVSTRLFLPSDHWLLPTPVVAPLLRVSSSLSAHAADSITTGSVDRDHDSRIGRNRVSPLLPMAMATLRRNPEKRDRLTGEPKNHRPKSASSSEASHSRAGFTSSWRGTSSASPVTDAFLFHGQTSWQMSHPKTLRPIPARRSSGKEPLFSIVR
jgi:hypothetical protein